MVKQLNNRQREFVVNICEKVVVYIITIAVIGRIIDIKISFTKLTVLIILAFLIFVIGLFIAGGKED